MSAMTCLWPVVQSALLALELTSSLVVPSDEEGGGEAAFATRGRAKVAKMKRKLHDYLFGWSFNWLRWAKNEIYEGEGSTVVRRIHFHLSRSKILQEQTSLEVSQKPFSLLSQILYIFWGPEMHDTTEKQRRVHEAKVHTFLVVIILFLPTCPRDYGLSNQPRRHFKVVPRSHGSRRKAE